MQDTLLQRSLQALTAALQGETERAMEALQTLPAPSPDADVEALVACGSAWLKLGQAQRALEYLQAAVAQAPDHGIAHARLGACLLVTATAEEAVTHLEQACTLLPTAGGAGLNLARCLLLLGRPAAARDELDRIAAFADTDPGLYNVLRAETETALGHTEEAEAHLRRGAASGAIRAIKTLVIHLAAHDRPDEADQIVREALEGQPENLELLDLASDLAHQRGRFGQAAFFLKRATEIDSANAALWARLATLATTHLDGRGAAEALAKALTLTEGTSGPLRAQALAAQAHLHEAAGNLVAAEGEYRNALQAFPHCVPALSGLGNLLLQLGRIDDAIANMEQLKQIDPLVGWSQLIQAREVPADPHILESIEIAARRPSLEGSIRSHLLFTLASGWERKKDYERAFTLTRQANEAVKKRLKYAPNDHRQRVDALIARYSAAFMASRQSFGHVSRLPVFVLGMPRSGTTLTEQILGSHSAIHGAGELDTIPQLIRRLHAWEMKIGSQRDYPDCVADLTPPLLQRHAEKVLAELHGFAPAAQFVVDKLPHNFEHIGLIKLLFPNATIFHCRRDPRDIAVSNYFTDFAAKFGGMGFAYDLAWIGEQLVDHDRLMDHWHAVFPGQIFEVVYEDLVEDTEAWARRMIDHLGLPWEAGVMDFQSLDRQVKTASVWQVRQPVYTTSKAKWKRYAEHLGPLDEALTHVPAAPAPLPLPTLPPGLFQQGMARLQRNDAAGARACFAQLVSELPNHAAAHHFLGAALFALGDAAAARAAMQRSIDLLGAHPQWLQNLAAVETALGNTEAAAQWRERASRMS
jgi:tetratricopeptide (TPR) repeat protein